jgi:mRNA-degrading endonuclease RelE of RelBE toxin-antitoxin system
MKRSSAGIGTDLSRLVRRSAEWFKALPYKSREQILRRIAFIETNPMMYQVEERGRWAGLRRFYAEGLVVFYAYWKETRSVYIEVVVPARGRER